MGRAIVRFELWYVSPPGMASGAALYEGSWQHNWVKAIAPLFDEFEQMQGSDMSHDT